MRVIILVAGQGTRLRPLTNDRPKCMVELNKKPLIQYQLDLFKEFCINDINVVTGYLEEKINFESINKFYNPDYASTNMLYTLFCAKELFDGSDDILISYGDIIYNSEVLTKIMDSKGKVNVVVDRDWKDYWQARMDNPLEDAETLKIDDNGSIKELGKKATSYDDIEGQYIGLIKIRKDFVVDFKNYYENLDNTSVYDGKDYNNMYMTSFLQLITENVEPLNPVFIHNGWMEIDAPSDLLFSSFVKMKSADNE